MPDVPEPAPAPVPRPARSHRSGGIWHVQLLGGFQLSCGARAPERPLPRAAALLLVRLLLQPEVAHLRDALGQWLWPHAVQRNGQPVPDPRRWRRAQLSRSLDDLRRLLQRPGLPSGLAIRATRDALQLNPAGFSTDLQAWQAAWAKGDGAPPGLPPELPDLLPGWHDAWLDAQRAELNAAWRAAQALNPGDSAPAAVAATPPAVLHPALPAAVRPALLPYGDAFFGRLDELQQLRSAVSGGVRLLVVQGRVGVGKTRLVAHALSTDFPHAPPAVLVPLGDLRPAPERAGDALLDRILETLLVHPSLRRPLQTLLTRLSGEHLLLVLDNYEQLSGASTQAVLRTLLDRLPRLQLLLTSSRSVPGPGAAVINLQPLPLPEPGDTLKTLAANPAVALFIDRAAAVRSGYKLTAAKRAGLIAACRALEGLPLAIELAAGKARRLPPHEVAAALEADPEELARAPSRARRILRHGSLQAVADWTWSLMDPVQRHGMVALSVFEAAFTLGQAQAVTGLPDAAPLLQALAQDNLLVPPASAVGAPRWRLPQVLRADAKRRAALAPWDAVAAGARQRHQQHFLAQLAAAEQAGQGLDPAELPEVLAAIAPMLAQQPAEPAMVAVVQLARVSQRWGGGPALLDCLQRAARCLPTDGPGHQDLRLLLPDVLVRGGQAAQALAAAEQALALAPAQPAARGAALLVATRVRFLAEQDGAAALEPARQALALLRQGGAAVQQAHALTLVGAATLSATGDITAARACFDEAHALFEAHGDRHGRLQAGAGIVACRLYGGDEAGAIEQAVPLEAEAQQLGDVSSRLQLINRIAEGQSELGRWQDALLNNRRLVSLARQHGSAYHTSFGLWNQCLPRARLRQPEQAALLMGFSSHYWQQHFKPLTASDQAHIRQVRRLVVNQTSIAFWRSAFERGQLLDEDVGLRLGGN